MNISAPELQPLRNPLAMFFIAALLSIAVTQWGLQQKEKAGAALMQATQNTSSREQKRQKIFSEKAAIARGQAIYEQFAQQDRSREQIRLAQSEFLDSLRKTTGLLGMDYKFSETSRNKGNDANTAVFASTHVTLSMQILHEEVLLDVLAQLNRRAEAIIVLRQCQIRRLPEYNEARLTADCEADWYSLGPNAQKS